MDDTNRLIAVALDQKHDVSVGIESNGALRAANNLNGRDNLALASVRHLQNQVVTLLLLGVGRELGVISHVVQRACNGRILNRNPSLELANRLAEDYRLPIFRRDGETV